MENSSWYTQNQPQVTQNNVQWEQQSNVQPSSSSISSQCSVPVYPPPVTQNSMQLPASQHQWPPGAYSYSNISTMNPLPNTANYFMPAAPAPGQFTYVSNAMQWFPNQIPQPPNYPWYTQHSSQVSNQPMNMHNVNSYSYVQLQPSVPGISPQPLDNQYTPLQKDDKSSYSEELWIKEWLSIRNKDIKTDEVNSAKPNISITVSQAKAQLKEAFSLLKQLSELKSTLKLLIHEDENTWRSEMKKMQPIQEALMKIMTVFSQQQVVDHLKKKLSRTHKKRIRMKRKHAEERQQAIKREQELLEFENAFQSWKEQIREKLLQDKMEKQMKAEADAILAEVRKKLSEAKKAKERLRLLEKLRQVRKDSVQRKGLFPSSESDKQFMEKVSSLKDLIQNQLVTYEAEERALRVMLETEHEGQKELQTAKKEKKLQAYIEERETDIIEGLFGTQDHPNETDPLYYYWQYYTQGERNLECLLQIRHDWDIYLVPPNEPEGSSVPSTWVVPDAPSSDAWATALKEA